MSQPRSTLCPVAWLLSPVVSSPRPWPFPSPPVHRSQPRHVPQPEHSLDGTQKAPLISSDAYRRLSYAQVFTRPCPRAMDLSWMENSEKKRRKTEALRLPFSKAPTAPRTQPVSDCCMGRQSGEWSPSPSSLHPLHPISRLLARMLLASQHHVLFLQGSDLGLLDDCPGHGQCRSH